MGSALSLTFQVIILHILALILAIMFFFIRKRNFSSELSKAQVRKFVVTQKSSQSIKHKSGSKNKI